MSVGIPVCTPSPQPPCFGVNFRVRGLIRLVSKGMETHLSCQIQLCALLAFKRREIFHFPHFSGGFFCFFSSSLFFFPPPLVYPILSSVLLLCSCFFLLFLVLPVGVAEGHSAHWLTFREERGGKRCRRKGQGRTVRTAEEGEGGSQADRLFTVQCSHHFLLQT